MINTVVCRAVMLRTVNADVVIILVDDKSNRLDDVVIADSAVWLKKPNDIFFKIIIRNDLSSLNL